MVSERPQDPVSVLTDAVGQYIRSEVSDWFAKNPSRIFMRINIEALEMLNLLDYRTALAVIMRLDGSTTFLPEHEGVHGPVSYELHALALRQELEVLLNGDELATGSVAALAREVSYLVQERSEQIGLQPGEEFDFLAPMCIVSRIKLMSEAKRRRFYEQLRSHLSTLDFGWRKGDSILLELKIRRDR